MDDRLEETPPMQIDVNKLRDLIIERTGNAVDIRIVAIVQSDGGHLSIKLSRRGRIVDWESDLWILSRSRLGLEEAAAEGFMLWFHDQDWEERSVGRTP